MHPVSLVFAVMVAGLITVFGLEQVNLRARIVLLTLLVLVMSPQVATRFVRHEAQATIPFSMEKILSSRGIETMISVWDDTNFYGFNPSILAMHVPYADRLPIGTPEYSALEPTLRNQQILTLDFELLVWICDRRRLSDLVSELNFAILDAFRANGIEIPYQQATSSGATSVSFRKANLALKVKPQITPDGNIIMTLDVNKDAPGQTTAQGVAINTKHVKTEVLVENGGTVVIGGIYEQTARTDLARVPFFGELPYIGFLFPNPALPSQKSALLVFIMPRVVDERLAIR